MQPQLRQQLLAEPHGRRVVARRVAAGGDRRQQQQRGRQQVEQDQEDRREAEHVGDPLAQPAGAHLRSLAEARAVQPRLAPVPHARGRFLVRALTRARFTCAIERWNVGNEDVISPASPARSPSGRSPWRIDGEEARLRAADRQQGAGRHQPLPAAPGRHRAERRPPARVRRRGRVRSRLRSAPRAQAPAGRRRCRRRRRRRHGARQQRDDGPDAQRAQGQVRPRHPERLGAVDRAGPRRVGLRAAHGQRGHRPRARRRDPGAPGEGAAADRGSAALRRRPAALVRGPAAARGLEVAGRRRGQARGDLGRPVDRVRRHRGLQRLVPRRQGPRPGGAGGRGRQRRARARRAPCVRGARERRRTARRC